jgi:TRAP-type C4-dicarboxylate transport system permease large subunit
MVANLALGMIALPFGVNLFAPAQVAGTSIDKTMRYLPVFIGVIFLCLLLITYMPALVLTLPNLMFR